LNVTLALIVALLGMASVVEVLACTGLVAMRTTLQRLHFVGPATCVAPWLVAVAVMLGTHATGNQAAKALAIALVLSLFSGVLAHETGCAARARDAEGQ
jgi:multisubunit Na+/H+ antiporter MnhG subunit